MKSYKNIAQLLEEKRRLKSERNELEKKIEVNWRDFKHSLTPKNITNQIIVKTLEKTKELNSPTRLVADSLLLIASRLTNVITQKAENKVSQWLKK